MDWSTFWTYALQILIGSVILGTILVIFAGVITAVIDREGK